MVENPYESPKTQPAPVEFHSPNPSQTISIAISAAQVLTGFVAGFAIWAATAPEEAWDANSLYSVFVLLAGLVSSFARPRWFYCGVIGVYFGQVLAMKLLVPVGVGAVIMPAFLAVLMFGTLPAVAGSLLGAVFGYCIELAMRRKPAK
jgi:hypothetical protein